MIRFIHSSDLHLGKRFGNFGGDLPSRLREARHTVIARLAQHARDQGAATILLAGDTFDTETPGPDVRRQALAEMRQHTSIRWVVLPGNHDSLQATELWATLQREAPENVVLAREARPIDLDAGVVLLPSPCTTRRPGRDLTSWMDDAATPDGTIRIGLAHGAVQSFSEESTASDVIAPDRARRAGLAYLALGDWHGPVEVGPSTFYCGAPEPDRFKHEGPGSACLVHVAGPTALPEVTTLRTASFVWRITELHLLDGDDPLSALDSLLPEAKDRRQALVRLRATGRSRLVGRTALSGAIEQHAPDFAYLELDETGLATECDVADLDGIDRGGALWEAANTLLAEVGDETRTASEREISRAALGRLHAYAQVVKP